MKFEARVVYLESGRIEHGGFSTQPELEQAAQVVRLFREFFNGKPAQFRQPIPFLKRGKFELEWTAAEGDVAFATIYESGEPATFAVLAFDCSTEAGQGVLAGFRKTLGLGAAETEPAACPLIVCAALPGNAEWGPMLQLLNTSLAAMFFDALSARQTP